MTGVVVDTDVVSFVFKNHPNGALYEADLAGRTLLLSFMTLAELDRWAIQSRWDPRAANGCGCISNDSCCCRTVVGSAPCGRK